MCFMCGEKAKMICDSLPVIKWTGKEQQVCDYMCYDMLVTGCIKKLRELEMFKQRITIKEDLKNGRN